MTRPSVRSRLINLSLVLLAFGLLALVVWQNREQVEEVRHRRPNLRLLALAFGIYMTALVLTFVRWYVLVRAQDLPFRLRDALRLGFIGNVFNQVIPGAVGGDVIKAAFLYREHARKAQAIGSMVIDRAVGLLGLFVLAAAMGIWIWPEAGADVRRLILLADAAVVAGLAGLAVLFTPPLYGPLHRLVTGRRRLEAVLDELIEMASAYRRKLGVVLGTLIMSSGTHALYVTSFYTVSRAVFPTLPTLAQHFLIVPLVLFTTVVPLPFGALGFTEEVSGQVFRFVAHPGGGVAMMAYRVLMYGGALVSVCVYLANMRQVRQLSREEIGDRRQETGENASSPPVSCLLSPVSSNPDEDPLPIKPQADQPEGE
jgi:uncharacterized protein (TIRG00374 family)